MLPLGGHGLMTTRYIESEPIYSKCPVPFVKVGVKNAMIHQQEMHDFVTEQFPCP